jgi:methylmalonyl-CoA mutase
MTRAVEAGLPKLRIEESAARKQARIDSNEDVVVGVNKYTKNDEDNIDTLEIDNDAVRKEQVARLKLIRTSRDSDACQATLDELTSAAKSGEGNLLDLSVKATRARATVGEISDALETVYTRHQANAQSISGIYGAAFEDDPAFRQIQINVEAFKTDRGRRPRILVTKMGQDGHDRGAKVIATAFADIGFDVDIGVMFQTPQEVAREAIENDVHLIGVSTQAGGHKTLVPELIRQLHIQGADDVVVICGGVIPARDYEFLTDAGVSGIYGPGTHIPSAAAEILTIIQERRNNA